MFLGTILLKSCHQGNTKIFVSCIGFQSVDTLVNIAFAEFLNFTLLKTQSSYREVVIRQKVNTLNKS
jgi:hypothetical protein